jgi:hypothetical protein
MNTKLLLGASAVVMGAAGVAGTFAPAEIARSTGMNAPLVIQLFAALLFASAMTNWMARGSSIGGIYNRPLAVGNATHFLIGALAIIKAMTAHDMRPPMIIAAAIYAIFALAFGALLFRSPAKPNRETI